jgi:hypothetical protein
MNRHVKFVSNLIKSTSKYAVQALVSKDNNSNSLWLINIIICNDSIGIEKGHVLDCRGSIPERGKICFFNT